MISIKNIFSRFYVDVKPRTNNYHIVHREGCPFLPEKEKRICLGANFKAQYALSEAKSYFSKSECCRFCMKEEQKERKELIFDEILYSDSYPVSSKIHSSHEDLMRSYAS